MPLIAVTVEDLLLSAKALRCAPAAEVPPGKAGPLADFYERQAAMANAVPVRSGEPEV